MLSSDFTELVIHGFFCLMLASGIIDLRGMGVKRLTPRRRIAALLSESGS